MFFGTPRAARRGAAGTLTLAVCLAAVALLLLPLVAILLEPFLSDERPRATYGALLSQAATLEPLLNSLAFATGSAALACLVAGFYAAMVVWTDVAGSRLITAVVLLPLFLPTMIYGFGWVLLAAPNSGMINHWLGSAFLNIYSLAGMIWAEALHSVPVVFLLFTGVFRDVSGDGVRLARMAGASRSTTVLRIMVPLIAPGVVAGFLLVFVRALGAFEIPAVLGITAGVELASTHIYFELRNSITDLSAVSAFASAIMLLAIALTSAGRVWAPAMGASGMDAAHGGTVCLKLGCARLPVAALLFTVLALLSGLPICALLIQSFSKPGNFTGILADPAIWVAGARSLGWSLCATVLVMILAVALVWTSTRMKSRLADRVISLAQIVFCLPGVIIGLGVLLFYGRLEWAAHNAGVLILIVYALRGVPYSLVYAQNALVPITSEIWDSGRASGASRLTVLHRVVLPLSGPALLAGATYILAISMREISATVLLYQPGQEFLSVFLWQFWQDGDLGRLAALSVCLTAVTAGLLLASYKVLATLPTR